MEKMQRINMTVLEAVMQTVEKAIEEVNTEPGSIEVDHVTIYANGEKYCELKSGIKKLAELSETEVTWGAGTAYLEYPGVFIYQVTDEEDGNESETV